MNSEAILRLIRRDKDLWFVVPVITTLLSFISEVLYYQEFNINIINYFSPIDFIFSQGSVLIYLLLIILIYYFLTTILQNLFDGTGKFLKFTYPKIKPLYASIISTILIFVYFICFKTTYEILNAFFIWLALVIPYHIYKNALKSVNRFFWMLLCIYFAMKLTIRNRIELAKMAYTNELSFKYNNKIITTDGVTKISIGQTRDYIFLYNKKNSSTQLYNMSNVDSLVIFKPTLYFTLRENKNKSIFSQIFE